MPKFKPLHETNVNIKPGSKSDATPKKVRGLFNPPQNQPGLAGPTSSIQRAGKKKGT